ncbi:hypothetical protein RJ639_021015 [Escallonia herrerae]|uniref:HAT C-terminal dimerisation domain-containing protein n=1 Tax=Escallonia herrerae TaxID=1293975 RepID=A0AA89AFH2_9ASTE|nr:hypothetical protein RJ639_021015 [Escallonia herrerae]
MFSTFKRFRALVEKQSGYQIKAIRSDPGGEFISKEFKAFYMSSEEIELSSASSISDNSSRPGLSKSKGKAIIMSEPVGEAIVATTNQSVINVELGKMEYEVSNKDFKYNHAKYCFTWFFARYKMTFIKFCFPKIYNEVESKKNIELVSVCLLEVYKEYVSNHALHCSNVTKESSVVGGSSSTTSTYKAKGKTEYDLCICEVNLESQVDVIGWWKANNLKYKILSKMAVDILSIPITTVASEAAFSTGGRVLDPYRASLSTKTVEAVICGGDWIRSLYGVKEVYTDKIKEEIVTFVVIAWEIHLSRLFLEV